MARASLFAGIAFAVLLSLRIYLAFRRRRTLVVGRRGDDTFVVREEGGFRELLIVSPTHEQVQSRQDLKNDLSSGPGYVDGFHLAMLGRSAERVLFLGGGACVGPRQFAAAYPTVHIDIVEREPAILDAARRHFRLVTSPRLVAHLADARAYLSTPEAAAGYDVVVVDTYDAYRMPGHLVTKEFFAEVRSKTRDEGAVVLNLVGNLKRTLVPGILAGLAEAFEGWTIAVFAVPDEAEGRHPISNFVVLVARTLPDTTRAEVAVAPFLPEIAARRREVPIDRDRAFTDAQAPTWVAVTE